MQHHRARDYAPFLDIFTSLDPFEGLHDRPMSLNGYSWVEGNPVMYIDPSGLSCDGGSTEMTAVEKATCSGGGSGFGNSNTSIRSTRQIESNINGSNNPGGTTGFNNYVSPSSLSVRYTLFPIHIATCTAL